MDANPTIPSLFCLASVWRQNLKNKHHIWFDDDHQNNSFELDEKSLQFFPSFRKQQIFHAKYFRLCSRLILTGIFKDGNRKGQTLYTLLIYTLNIIDVNLKTSKSGLVRKWRS